MENSRHANTIITLSAYIIGFTSAYIAFGVPPLETADIPVQVANVITSTNQNIQLTVDTAPTEPVIFATSDTFNLLISTDVLRLVSDDSSRALALVAPDESESIQAQGTFIYDIISAAISPDESFVFYCAQEVLNGEVCQPYIYDVKNDLIYKLLTNDANVLLSEVQAQPVWSDDGILTVGGFISTTADTPWK